jgi:hypothetical protein
MTVVEIEMSGLSEARAKPVASRVFYIGVGGLGQWLSILR